MTNMPARYLKHCLWSLLAITILGGCRTYGGHGSEAGTLEGIRRANQLFAEELSRAEANLALLSRRASTDAALQDAVPDYQAVVEAHEALLERHRLLEEEVAEKAGDYRALHHAYSAIISEQQIVRDRYRELLAEVDRESRGDSTAVSLPERPYNVVPPYYDRVYNASINVRIESALQGAGVNNQVYPDTSGAGQSD